MRKSLARFPAAAIFALAAVPDLAGSSVPVAVMTSDSAHYGQALEGFTEAWGSTVTIVFAGEMPAEGLRAIVAIGGKAAALRWPRDAVVVACLAPSILDVPGDAVTRVSLLSDPGALIAQLRALMPGLALMRVFWSSEASRADSEALVKAGGRKGLVVVSERVKPASSLPAHLRSLRGRADALWLMPDPALVTERNFATLREYAVARNVPLFAPAHGLAERGATATIASTYRDMGRAAAFALRARLTGGAAPEVVFPERPAVTANGPAARAAGLKLDASVLVLP